MNKTLRPPRPWEREEPSRPPLFWPMRERALTTWEKGSSSWAIWFPLRLIDSSRGR